MSLLEFMGVVSLRGGTLLSKKKGPSMLFADVTVIRDGRTPVWLVRLRRLLRWLRPIPFR